MGRSFGELTDYLRALGTDKVPHSKTPFLAHLIGVYRDLKEWGCEEPLVLAGLFHSIYGTEAFQGFYLPLSKREEIRELIGARAERLAYVNCALTRESLDASLAAGGPPRLWDRFEDRPLEVTEEEFTDLITLHLCDRLEQVGRTGNWPMRRQAWENMARRLGGVALERWERVYSQAPAVV
jgi:(p)ppGpp synthase/HD superfamily hydrolase